MVTDSLEPLYQLYFLLNILFWLKCLQGKAFKDFEPDFASGDR